MLKRYALLRHPSRVAGIPEAGVAEAMTTAPLILPLSVHRGLGEHFSALSMMMTTSSTSNLRFDSAPAFPRLSEFDIELSNLAIASETSPLVPGADDRHV